MRAAQQVSRRAQNVFGDRVFEGVPMGPWRNVYTDAMLVKIGQASKKHALFHVHVPGTAWSAISHGFCVIFH